MNTLSHGQDSRCSCLSLFRVSTFSTLVEGTVCSKTNHHITNQPHKDIRPIVHLQIYCDGQFSISFSSALVPGETTTNKGPEQRAELASNNATEVKTT